MQKPFVISFASALLFVSSALGQGKNLGPVKAYPEPGVISTLQDVTPAGIQSVFEGTVSAATFDLDPSLVWVLTTHELVEFDWRSNRVVRSIAVHGDPGMQALRYDADRQRVLYTVATNSATRKPLQPVWKYRLLGTDVQLFSAGGDGQKLVAASIGTENSGALDISGNTAAIPLTRDDEIAVVDLDGQLPVKHIPTAIAPYSVVLSPDAKVAWVSNWGGRKAEPGESTAPSGYSETADLVLVDARGIASSGTLSRIDLTTGKTTLSLEVGLHPTAMVWDHAHGQLYVATTNQDSVTVVDTDQGTIAAKINIQPFPAKVVGVAPTALTLSPDGAKLYVACGGINAVAIVDVRTQKIDGMIPTGWYPSTISISSDGSYLAIGTLFGHGSGWKDQPTHRYVHASRGSMSLMPTPTAAQLASYTSVVAENNQCAPSQATADTASPR